MGFNVKKDEDEAQVNELVDVIDRLMMGGQGHLTIDGLLSAYRRGRC